MSVQALLTQQFALEHADFLAALEAVPDGEFAAAPGAGGHSAAWIALHILEWTLLNLPESLGGGRRPQYAHLGWEDADWVRPLRGPPLAQEGDPKAEILARLARALAQSRAGYAALPDAAFAPDYRTPTPFGERALSDALTRQLRHIAYHRGQVVLLTRQLSLLSTPRTAVT